MMRGDPSGLLGLDDILPGASVAEREACQKELQRVLDKRIARKIVHNPVVKKHIRRSRRIAKLILNNACWDREEEQCSNLANSHLHPDSRGTVVPTQGIPGIEQMLKFTTQEHIGVPIFLSSTDQTSSAPNQQVALHYP